MSACWAWAQVLSYWKFIYLNSRKWSFDLHNSNYAPEKKVPPRRQLNLCTKAQLNATWIKKQFIKTHLKFFLNCLIASFRNEVNWLWVKRGLDLGVAVGIGQDKESTRQRLRCVSVEIPIFSHLTCVRLRCVSKKFAIRIHS